MSFLILRWLGWGYIASMSSWLLLRLLLSNVWWIVLLNYVAVYLFIPLPALLIFCIWRRRGKLMLGLSIPTVGFVLLYGALFTPSLSPQSAAGRSLTVMTFNTKFGNQNVAALIEAIRDADADVVGVQEITPELATALASALTAGYPYGTLTSAEMQAEPAGANTVGLLSRFPVSAITHFSLPGQRNALDADTGQEIPILGPRIGVEAKIDIGEGRSITGVVVDLLHNPTLGEAPGQWAFTSRTYYRQKRAEIERLQQLDQDGLPFLLLCDCNLSSASDAYVQLSRFVQDSFQEKGWGLGHTLAVEIGGLTLAAGQRFDYVWHSSELTTTRIWVAPSTGSSDHFPVIAEITVNQASLD